MFSLRSMRATFSRGVHGVEKKKDNAWGRRGVEKKKDNAWVGARACA